MIVNRFANADATRAGEFKRGIDFCHALLEPERPEPLVMPKQKMRVFVKDDLERARVRFSQRERDQIFVAATLEKRAQIGRPALIERQKGFQSLDRKSVV